MKGELDALPPGMQHCVFTIFRRTAASGMAGLGTAPHVIEAVLNHRRRDQGRGLGYGGLGNS
jgi:hypothetical protein